MREISTYKTWVNKNNQKIIIISIFLIITICITYGQVVNHEFISFDDDQYIFNNNNVIHGLNVKSFLWALTSFYPDYWHPMTWYSHMLDCQMFGLNSGMHHLVNVFFHISNTLLVFIVFYRMTGSLWKSAFVAALFGLHPLHVESVAWSAERKDLLSTFFWMLTMLSYQKYVQQRKIQRYLIMILFYILGLLSKPMLVTLPFTLLLLDYWPLQRLRLQSSHLEKAGPYRDTNLNLIWEKIPLVILAILSSLITFLAQHAVGAMSSLTALPIHIRIINIIESYAFYIEKMLWPLHLAVIYPYSPELVSLWFFVIACFFIIIISAAAFITSIRYPWFIVGWLWYLGTLVPVVGIVQVGLQTMADRYTYIPLIGLFIIFAWGLPELLKRWQYRQIVLEVSAGIILSILIIISWVQIGYWKNDYTLFGHALKVTENNYVAHSYIAKFLIDRGDFDSAINHGTEALRINPNYSYTYYIMGLALKNKGDLSGAIDNYAKAIRLDSNSIEAYNNLGNIYGQQGKFNDAIKQYSKVLEINPGSEVANVNMGITLVNLGRVNEAIHYYNKALLIKPDYKEAEYNIGVALLLQGKIDESIQHYKKVLIIDPRYMNVNEILLKLLEHKSKIEAATADLKKELLNDSRNTGDYIKLGDIYFSSGDRTMAVASYEKAVLIEPENVQALNRLAVVYSGWEENEKALDAMMRILKAQPGIVSMYYNIACMYAKQDMVNESIGWLKLAIKKGFHDWDLIKKDPDLANIRNTSYINEFMKNH